MVVENVNGTELRFKNPGRLLLVVIGFLFWGVGFLDLLGHTSAEPDILGLYSLPFFIFILLYGSLFFVWVLLFFNANLLSRVVDGIRLIQSRTWLSLLLLAGLFFAIWIIFEWDRWARLPGLQFALFGLIMLAILILIFAEWGEKKDEQVWRKFVAYPLFVLFAVELLLQALAWFGLLPGSYKLGGDFYTYERVYYNGESLRNGFANRYGWYYPDAALNDKNKRILLLGSSYLQGLQVQPEQQMSVYLARLMNQAEPDVKNEVVSIGLPGFGLAPFLYEDTMREMPANLNSKEIIVFYHLGDDFQSPVESQNSIRYTVTDAGTVAVNPEDARLQHDLTHYFLRGFISFQLVGTIRSNYLTPRVIHSWLTSSTRDANTASVENRVEFPRKVGHVTDYYTITEPGHAGIKSTELEIIPQGNNFMFRQGSDDERQDVMLIADDILGKAQEIARANGITLRLVTVPMFPEEFYLGSASQPWEPELDEFDLLLPERELMEIANRHDIPILPMGQFMLQNGLSAEDIQALYLPNEEGSFSSKGNEYFADAIYTCFYSLQANKNCPE
jgi:hypothetical protein